MIVSHKCTHIWCIGVPINLLLLVNSLLLSIELPFIYEGQPCRVCITMANDLYFPFDDDNEMNYTFYVFSSGLLLV